MTEQVIRIARKHSEEYLRNAELVRRAFAAQERRNETERRYRSIEAGRIEEGECLDGYIIHRVTKGCANRARRELSPPKFLVWDATYSSYEEGIDYEHRVLKFANPDLLIKKPGLEAMLQNEAAVLSRLEHRNIVQVFPEVRKQGMLYIPMEHLPFQIPDIIGLLPTMRGMLFFATESAKALQYLKSQGVVHGDLKLSQFMAGRDPDNEQYSVIKLVDFAGSTHPAIPPPRTTSFTPNYAAPEVLRAENRTDRLKALTHKADIYALAHSYAHLALVSQKVPTDKIIEIFDNNGSNAERIIEAIYAHHVPYLLNRIIEDMLEENPDERICADELADRLEEFCTVFAIQFPMVLSRDLYTKEPRRQSEKLL